MSGKLGRLQSPINSVLCSRAFTLVELLVVISIIALLISILLPSLRGAREAAKAAVCLSHLRSLSHGWHMYADDHNDVCLPGRYAKAPGGTTNPANWYDVGNGMKYRPRWVATMGKYVGIYAFNQPRTDTDRQAYDSEVYQCPKVPEWINERNYAYGYNHQFLGNARRTNSQFHNFPVNRSRIRAFAGTVLGADCMGTAAGVARTARQPYDPTGGDFNQLGNHGWTLDPPRLTAASDKGTGDITPGGRGSPMAGPDPRHRNRLNAVFCDGHAESITPQRLGYRYQEDGALLDTSLAGNPTPDDPAGLPTNENFSGSGRDDDPPALPG
jgi:prepilin-type N-terminal cleavage/methylation domain-containing protein/prepilin-type processing-associated H-X9-DG protein